MSVSDKLEEDWLHLFTSTVRELYITDALGLLAAPFHTHYRFRYEKRYVSEQLWNAWASNGLGENRVILHFSLQHPERFHAASYLPLRLGKVVRTDVEGDTCVIHFSLDDYAPLADAPEEERAERVREYTSELRQLLDDRHPDHSKRAPSAAMGPSPEALLVSTGDAGRDFQTVVRYLRPCLYFSPSIFFRVADVTDDKDGTSASVSDDGDVLFTSGHRYTIWLAHYQPQPPDSGVAVKVSTPAGVELLGPMVLALTSRYDMIPLRVFVANRDDVMSAEMELGTQGPMRGPRVRLPLIVVPPNWQAAAWPLLGVGGAVAVALPPILASGEEVLLRGVLALAGTVMVGLGASLRRQKGLNT